jgi:hypothetical protein
LELTGLPGNLLKDHSAEKMRVLLALRLREEAIRYARHVVPERLPLAFLVPHVGSLKERYNQTLRLHEHCLRRANLGLHA